MRAQRRATADVEEGETCSWWFAVGHPQFGFARQVAVQRRNLESSGNNAGRGHFHIFSSTVRISRSRESNSSASSFVQVA